MARCPQCKSDVEEGTEFRPFCSERCKMVDLGRWFGEEFVVSRTMTPLEYEEVVDDVPTLRDDGSPYLH